MGKNNNVEYYKWLPSKYYKKGLICWSKCGYFLRVSLNDEGLFYWEYGVSFNKSYVWGVNGTSPTMDDAKLEAIKASAPRFDVMLEEASCAHD